MAGKAGNDHPYIFRRLDNDKLVRLPFSAVLDQDRLGYITLEDGVQAKRCQWLEEESEPVKAKAVHTGINKHDLSLSLGFSKTQLAEFEADRIKHGFKGVEFYPDPHSPNMIGVKAGSEAEKERYIKHRGYFNKSSRNGSKMGKEELEMARKLIIERHGDGKEAEEAKAD
jgi:hypothetical protein